MQLNLSKLDFHSHEIFSFEIFLTEYVVQKFMSHCSQLVNIFSLDLFDLIIVLGFFLRDFIELVIK